MRAPRPLHAGPSVRIRGVVRTVGRRLLRAPDPGAVARPYLLRVPVVTATERADAGPLLGEVGSRSRRHLGAPRPVRRLQPSPRVPLHAPLARPRVASARAEIHRSDRPPGRT